MKPEGSIGRCPIGRTTLPPPKSLDGEVLCPRCDGELWHLMLASQPTFFLRRRGETIYDVMAGVADPRDGLTAESLKTSFNDADPFDVAELMATLATGFTK